MFKKINQIKDFGVFHNFGGAALPEFRQFNLIFGWNYSGKTTLSRVFQCLEHSNHHPDYSAAKFSLRDTADQDFDEKFGHTCNVRVFNEDFRAQNLKWGVDDGINPIFILGEENIELQGRLDSTTAEREASIQEKANKQAEADEIEAAISAAETQCGATIGRELNIRPFDKRHVKQIYDSFNGVLPTLLSDDQFAKAKTQASATEIKEEIPLVAFTPTSTRELAEQVQKTLSEQVVATASLARLRDNPALAAWVEHGLTFHPAPVACEFCQSTLTDARLKELNAHFSDALRALRERARTLLERAKGAMPTLDRGLYVASSFYTDMHERRKEASAKLEENIVLYQDDIRSLTVALQAKLDDPFSTPDLPTFVSTSSGLQDAIDNFNSLVADNNNRTREFDAAKASALAMLKNHYVSEAMMRIDRLTKEARLSLLAANKLTLQSKIAQLGTEIHQISLQLSDAAKGAERVNGILVQFFGKRDLTVAIGEAGRFKLMRGDTLAKNLSEGERTAIAFSYFIAKLSENGNELSNTIVYIDDPISSLDANHLLNVNAIIKNTFYEFDAAKNPKHRCRAKQLFVSTHNYDLFHLLWEWFHERTPKEFASAYLIRRSDSNGLTSSTIIECPLSIRRYRSEYLFLFHQIKQFLDDPKEDLQVIFNLSNMARRFMEGYLHFKFLTHMNIDQDIGRVIADPIACERARKFLHYYSHTLNRGAGMKVPDLAEASLALQDLLDGIRAHDPTHYRALEDAAA